MNATMSPEDREAVQRLLTAVDDYSKMDQEPYHAQDCPACYIADEIVAMLAADLDPLENWYPDDDDPPEAEADSYAHVLVRRVAFILHRRLAGHGRAA